MQIGLPGRLQRRFPLRLRRRRVASIALAAVCVGGFAAAGPVRAATSFVGIADSNSGGGWTVTSAGAVTPFGGAQLYGSLAHVRLARPIVGIAASPDGHGYWLVASDGGVFSFGDARFYGSTGGIRLARPVVGMAATGDGHGYWLVASDGGVFSFGDARFHGSTGGWNLPGPIVGMAPSPLTGGYWLLDREGAVYPFGAPDYGGSPGTTVAGISPDMAGGYSVVDASGRVLNLGGRAATTTTVAPTTTTTTAAPTTTTVVPTTTTVASPSGGLQLADPNLPDSVFSRPVTDDPVTSNSSALVSNLVSQIGSYYGTVGVNQMPIFEVPAGQPLVNISVTSGCNDFTGSTGTSIPIPADAYTTDPNYQHDSDMLIYQPSTDSVWELWKAAKSSDGSWSACWGGRIDSATTNGVFDYPYGLSATGISYTATMITEHDILSGAIDHAIAMQIPECAGVVLPADRMDCTSGSGNPPEGTWLRMPPSLPMPGGLTPFGQMVFRALQTYGAVVTDHAGAVMLQGESAQDWTVTGHTGTDPLVASWEGKPEYEALSGMPWWLLQAIQPPG